MTARRTLGGADKADKGTPLTGVERDALVALAVKATAAGFGRIALADIARVGQCQQRRRAEQEG